MSSSNCSSYKNSTGVHSKNEPLGQISKSCKSELHASSNSRAAHFESYGPHRAEPQPMAGALLAPERPHKGLLLLVLFLALLAATLTRLDGLFTGACSNLIIYARGTGFGSQLHHLGADLIEPLLPLRIQRSVEIN